MVVQRRWWAGARRSRAVTAVPLFPRLHPHGTDAAALGCITAIQHEVQTAALRRRPVQALAPTVAPGPTQFLLQTS